MLKQKLDWENDDEKHCNTQNWDGTQYLSIHMTLIIYVKQVNIQF